jgi:hypothetical protein
VLEYTTSDSREKRELYERKVSTSSRYLQRMLPTHLLLIEYERGVPPSSQPPNRKKKQLFTQCIPDYLQYCCYHTTWRPPNVAISVGDCFSRGSSSISSPDSDVKERVRRGSSDRGLRVCDSIWWPESKDVKSMGFGVVLPRFRLFGRLNMASD